MLTQKQERYLNVLLKKYYGVNSKIAIKILYNKAVQDLTKDEAYEIISKLDFNNPDKQFIAELERKVLKELGQLDMF